MAVLSTYVQKDDSQAILADNRTTMKMVSVFGPSIAPLYITTESSEEHNRRDTPSQKFLTPTNTSTPLSDCHFRLRESGS